MAKPFVLKNTINSWPAIDWTPQIIGRALSDKILKIRLGSKNHTPGDILWETDSIYVDATLNQLLSWHQGETSEENPLSKFDLKDFWAYVDYKYMFDLFDGSENDQYLRSIDWGETFGCGLENRDGVDSTFWLGTKGAYTPCHYDTYGFNLVAQLYGRKRWILFPPHDDLNATRLPYEESSVFSSIDFIAPNANQLRHCHPHSIILEPGDVLFVPPRWWHFVQCMSDLSISVNTWIDTPADDRQAKSMEALTHAIMALLSKDTGNFVIADSTAASSIDNGDPTSSALEVETSLLALNANILEEKKVEKEENMVMNEFLKHWRSRGIDVSQIKDIDEFCQNIIKSTVLNIVTDDRRADVSSENHQSKIEKHDLLKAITHPDCVRVIYDRLMRVKKMQ